MALIQLHRQHPLSTTSFVGGPVVHDGRVVREPHIRLRFELATAHADILGVHRLKPAFQRFLLVFEFSQQQVEEGQPYFSPLKIKINTFINM